jgi:hypothetical protein
MFKLSILFSLLVTLIFFNSCSEEITLSNDQKETAVIYGLLDQADTIHYIKINRAFSGMNNSIEVAQIPDSSYFKEVNAYVYEVKKGDTLRKWKLRDTIVSNKEEGLFYGPTQKVYYFETKKNAPLIGESGRNYVFHASLDNNKFSVTASTELIYGNSLGYPVTSGGNYGFANGNMDKPEFYSTGIKFKPGTSVTTNTTLRITIREYIGQNYTLKSFDWNVGDLDVSPGQTLTGISALGSAFYPLIAKNCTNNPAITKRQLASIELNVTFGSEALSNYITLNKPSSSLAQNKTNFTNLSATNGMRVLGVFTSRNVKTDLKLSSDVLGQSPIRAMDSQSTKELCLGQTTGKLMFCSDVPADINTTFHCN